MKKNKKIIILTISIILLIFIILLFLKLTSQKATAYTSSSVEDVQNSSNTISTNNRDGRWTIINESETTINVSSNNRNAPQENKSSVPKSNIKGTIYLTFDDGPSKDCTPKILDILKKENVKATFFILNYSQDKEELVKREIEEGHSVGIHGYSHEYKEIYKSEEAYMENLNKLQQKIENTTGFKSQITRFPGGSSNTISHFNKGIMTKLSKLVEQNGYKYYDWNVDSDDAGSAKNKKQVYNNVTQGISKKKGNVVLMHDFGGNYKTVDALSKIIKYGKENGYRFDAITYDCGVVMHHGIQN